MRTEQHIWNVTHCLPRDCTGRNLLIPQNMLAFLLLLIFPVRLVEILVWVNVHSDTNTCIRYCTARGRAEQKGEGANSAKTMSCSVFLVGGIIKEKQMVESIALCPNVSITPARVIRLLFRLFFLISQSFASCYQCSFLLLFSICFQDFIFFHFSFKNSLDHFCLCRLSFCL